MNTFVTKVAVLLLERWMKTDVGYFETMRFVVLVIRMDDTMDKIVCKEKQIIKR